MADRKISDLTALTTPAAGDYLPIVDISEAAAANKNKRITIEELMRGMPDGTAAAPSIAFESDPNTGIYSPGADQVAVATNGAGRLYVTSLGRVGVNTDSPGFIFQIQHSTEDGIRLRTANTSDSHIDFADTDANGRGRINYDHATDSMGFRTAGAERLRITSTGQIQSAGLGSAASPALSFTTDTNTGIYSPGADQVAVATNGAGRLFISDNGVATGGAPQFGYGGIQVRNSFIYVNEDGANTTQMYLRTSSNEAAIQVATNHPFKIQTNNQERLRITSAGLVGVGTSGPTQTLHVENTNLTNPSLTWGASATQVIRVSGIRELALGVTGAAPYDCYLQARSNASAAQSLLLNPVGGNVGIGTSSPSTLVEGQITGPGGTPATSGTSQPNAVFRVSGSGTTGVLDIGCNSGAPWIQATDRADLSQKYSLLLNPNGGNVGIGTTSPNSVLQVNSGTNLGGILVGFNASSSNFYDADLQVFRTGNGTERARIDSSGRLLVGTSTSRGNNFNTTGADMRFQVEGTDYATSGASFTSNNVSATEGPHIVLNRSRGATIGSNTVVQSGDRLGVFVFEGSDGTEFVTAATIDCLVDGTPGANDMPGRLVFSTTADGASSPTRRVVMRNNGWVLFGQDVENSDAPGFGVYGPSGFMYATVSDGTVARFNRQTSDGEIIDFSQDNAKEGSISVSGTTVSYNGAHLSRWSQLPGGAERNEILRGTVLSNINEMCEWGEEDNEQLNRMKVSDVEGDKNVSGVFQAWDDDDDTYINDFYCAMTGDFIIRIAQGVTVERGDLLMSAGDGTAKPQDDDIIRSKTIAKVTSTNVSCAYPDGSYCVPCVLMAC